MWCRRDCLRALALSAMGASGAVVRAESRVAAATPAARTASGRLVIAVNDKATFAYLPLTLADRLGYFSAEGLNVQIRDLNEPGQALQALLSGSVQALSAPFSQTVQLLARGQRFPSIVLQGRASQVVLGVSRKTLGGFRTLRDLRGHRVAITALGSDSHRLVQVLLASAQMGSDDVHFLPMPSASVALAAFRQGQVDAICYADPLVTLLEQDGALRVVADTRTVRGNADVFGGHMPAGCVSVSADYLERHGPECQALVNAVVHALKWLQTAGPSDIIKTVPESFFQGDRALYLAAFSRSREAWVPDGLMPESGPNNVARMLARVGEKEFFQSVELAQTFTNVLAKKAKARFRA